MLTGNAVAKWFSSPYDAWIFFNCDFAVIFKSLSSCRCLFWLSSLFNSGLRFLPSCGIIHWIFFIGLGGGPARLFGGRDSGKLHLLSEACCSSSQLWHMSKRLACERCNVGWENIRVETHACLSHRGKSQGLRPLCIRWGTCCDSRHRKESCIARVVYCKTILS